MKQNSNGKINIVTDTIRYASKSTKHAYLKTPSKIKISSTPTATAFAKNKK